MKCWYIFSAHKCIKEYLNEKCEEMQRGDVSSREIDI